MRLMAAGMVLARHDALAPREFAHLLPAPARFGASVVRLLAGGYGRKGRPGQRLATAFEKLGPVAIKLGQLLSTRADIFGTEFAEDLMRDIKTETAYLDALQEPMPHPGIGPTFHH